MRRVYTLILTLFFALPIAVAAPTVDDESDKAALLPTLPALPPLGGVVVVVEPPASAITVDARFTARPIQGSNCVAPCAVHFDGIGGGALATVPFITLETEDSAFDRPMHSLNFYWTFDDAGGSCGLTWANDGTSKNTAIGGQAAHTYCTAGTYYPTLCVRNPNGEEDCTTHAGITVLDPATRFSTSETWCFSNNTSFTGCPLDTVGGDGVCDVETTHCVASTSDLDNTLQSATATIGCDADGGSERRCMYKAGDTYTNSASPLQPGSASSSVPVSIERYGSGADPIFALATTELRTQNGVTYKGIHFTGSGTSMVRVEENRGNITYYDSMLTYTGTAYAHLLVVAENNTNYPTLVAFVDTDVIGGLRSSITSIANTTPISITSLNHPYSTGNTVIIKGSDVAAINEQTYTITDTGTDTFTLNGTSASGAGGAAGYAVMNRTPGAALLHGGGNYIVWQGGTVDAGSPLGSVAYTMRTMHSQDWVLQHMLWKDPGADNIQFRADDSLLYADKLPGTDPLYIENARMFISDNRFYTPATGGQCLQFCVDSGCNCGQTNAASVVEPTAGNTWRGCGANDRSGYIVPVHDIMVERNLCEWVGAGTNGGKSGFTTEGGRFTFRNNVLHLRDSQPAGSDFWVVRAKGLTSRWGGTTPSDLISVDQNTVVIDVATYTGDGYNATNDTGFDGTGCTGGASSCRVRGNLWVTSGALGGGGSLDNAGTGFTRTDGAQTASATDPFVGTMPAETVARLSDFVCASGASCDGTGRDFSASDTDSGNALDGLSLCRPATGVDAGAIERDADYSCLGGWHPAQIGGGGYITGIDISPEGRSAVPAQLDRRDFYDRR